jgi:hypothetical protein
VVHPVTKEFLSGWVLREGLFLDSPKSSLNCGPSAPKWLEGVKERSN